LRNPAVFNDFYSDIQMAYEMSTPG